MRAQDAIAAVLGICFRSLANSKNTDSVVSTAAATVRQVSAFSQDHDYRCLAGIYIDWLAGAKDHGIS